MARKEQQLINTATGAITYVTMPDSLTFEQKRQPTSAELLTAKNALPSGYVWTIVGPANGGSIDPADQSGDTDSVFYTGS